MNLKNFVYEISSRTARGILEEVPESTPVVRDRWAEGKVAVMFYHARFTLMEIKVPDWEFVREDLFDHLEVFADHEQWLLTDWLGSSPIRFALAERVSIETADGPKEDRTLHKVLLKAQMQELKTLAEGLVEWMREEFHRHVHRHRAKFFLKECGTYVS